MSVKTYSIALSQKFVAEIALAEAEFPKPRQGRYQIKLVQIKFLPMIRDSCKPFSPKGKNIISRR
jgi:hypothetical protein